MSLKKIMSTFICGLLMISLLVGCSTAGKVSSVADSYDIAMKDVKSYRTMFSMSLKAKAAVDRGIIDSGDIDMSSEQEDLLKGMDSAATVTGYTAVLGDRVHGSVSSVDDSVAETDSSESKPKQTTGSSEFYFAGFDDDDFCYVKSAQTQAYANSDKSIKSAWQKSVMTSDEAKSYKAFVDMANVKNISSSLFNSASFVDRDKKNVLIISLADYVQAGLLPTIFGIKDESGKYVNSIADVDLNNSKVVSQLSDHDVVLFFDKKDNTLSSIDIPEVFLEYNTFTGEGRSKTKIACSLSFSLHLDFSDYNKIADAEVNVSSDMKKNAIEMEDMDKQDSDKKDDEKKSEKSLTDEQLDNRTKLVGSIFKYNNKEYHMPFDVSVLLDDGWNVENPSITVPANKMSTKFEWKSSKYDKVHPFFGLYNGSAGDSSYKDCEVYVFSLDVAVCDKNRPNFELPAGITWGASKKDVEKAYGRPDVDTKQDFYRMQSYFLLDAKGNQRGLLNLYYYDKGKDVKTPGLAKFQYQIY